MLGTPRRAASCAAAQRALRSEGSGRTDIGWITSFCLRASVPWRRSREGRGYFGSRFAEGRNFGFSPPATSNVTTTGGTAQHLAMFTKATNIQNSIVLQMGTTAIDVVGNLGINNTTPSQSLDIKSGNAIVRAGNFLKAGNTATLYVGDTGHPIEAIWGSGLQIGTFKAPKALFIADITGNVEIGITTPTAGILNTVANSNSVVGLSTAGWNAPTSSNLNGTNAFHATGGNGDGVSGGNGGVA